MSAVTSFNDLARARDALFAISPDLPRPEWIRVGMAAKSAGLDFDDFDSWSALGHQYVAADARVAWRSFRTEGAVGAGTLFHAAREAGWRDDAARRPKLTQAEIEAAENRRAARAAADLAEQEAEEARAAERAQAIWNAALPVAQHPYLARKGVRAHGARFAAEWVKEWTNRDGQVRQAKYRDALLVPIMSGPKQVASLQAIFPTKCIGPKDARRDKDYLAGGRKRGCYFIIGRVKAGEPVVVLCEGFATGASIHEATGLPVMVCFDAGNLSAVASALRDKLPESRIILAADNDVHSPGNPGVTAARAAASRVGGLVAIPPAAGDFNDLALAEGSPAVAAVIEAAQAAAQLSTVAAAPTVGPANENAGPGGALPIFDNLQGLPRIELAGREAAWWVRLGGESDPVQAAALAWAICRKRAVGIPSRTTVDALIATVQANSVALHPQTVAAMRQRLTWWVNARQREALRHVTVPAEVLQRHRHEVHQSLPALGPDDYQGVILLWAGMGSGKTKHVGAPFAAYAAQVGRFVATCHRRSLVTELARVMGATHYTEVDRENAWAVNSLATCLPSITKAGHAQIMDECEYLFIDEIAQVLRFLESDKACRTDDGTNADVYQRLRGMVRGARCVIGADAGMDARVVQFLEECRPGERFRIIEVPTPSGAELTAHYGYGDEAIAEVYGEMQARLADGQKIWVSCESEKRVAEVARLLERTGKRVLALTAANKGDAAQARFWQQPEAVSARYDAVVHSPVISSGLSITHQAEGPHFDHGFFIGGGHAIAPADAVQMIRRVRYLRQWSVAFVANNLRGQDDPDAMLAGMDAAAAAEGLSATATAFDAYVARVKADNNAAKADFAAGMLWVLERAGFTLAPLQTDAGDEADPEMLAQLREELTAERRAAILAAAELDDDQARRLRSAEHRTQAQSDALTKHAVRKALGLDTGEVDEEALDVWDDGRGPRRLDRFSAMQGVAGREAAVEHLTHRRFYKARVWAYRTLFEGLTVAPGLRIDDAMAELLVRRAIEHRQVLAWLGIVPGRYGAAAMHDKAGGVLRFPMPKAPQKDVGEIFRAMGLKLKRRRNRHVDVACYEIDADSFRETNEWANKRNSPTSLVPLIQGTPRSGTVQAPTAIPAQPPKVVRIAVHNCHAKPALQLLFRLKPNTPLGSPSVNVRHIRVAA